jgi:hypothetical protein
MGMSYHSFVNWFPRINVEIALPAIKTLICKFYHHNLPVFTPEFRRLSGACLFFVKLILG